MKSEPMLVIRVIRAFEAENLEYALGEICGVRASLAKRFVSEGLAEIVNVKEQVDETDETDEEDETADGPEWAEPQLGSFRYVGFGWTRRVELPAFEAFGYGARRSKSRPKYEVVLETEDEEEFPGTEAVALAKRVLDNQGSLVQKVVDALWADFTGSGPNSGMYWHGDLDQVAEGIEDGEPPQAAGDLFKLMRLDGITIKPAEDGDGAVLAELNFNAAFEQEHGVGILTDGVEILGLGYSSDVRPFEH